jgi:outer membrane protein assembly factor BamE
MIDQLKPGMTKTQVKFIMGTPLIADTFNQNRWDYFYGLKPAEGEEVRERMVIFFKDDKLSYAYVETICPTRSKMKV